MYYKKSIDKFICHALFSRQMLCIIVTTAILLLPMPSLSATYLNRDEVQIYVDEVIEAHHLDRSQIENIFRRVKKQESALKAIQSPAEGKPWYRYREIFLTDTRVEQGVVFWRENRDALDEARRRFAVPQEIIVAIIGIETFYGKYMGKYPVMDVLVTLAFDYPRSSKFFRRELTEFLLLCSLTAVSCSDTKGSYAGAIGYGQFIPSSYRAYGIDFDKDGKKLLLGSSVVDSIGSVANYLKEHKWKSGGNYYDYVVWPSAEELVSNTKLMNANLRPWLTLQQVSEKGIDTIAWKVRESPFTLWSFEKNGGETVVLAAYQNSYVISRYNHSRKYVLAVIELAKSIGHKIGIK